MSCCSSATTPSCALTCKDVPFLFTEVVSGCVAITSAFENNRSWAWIIYASTFALVTSAHVAVRKFGNICTISRHLEETAHQIEATQARTEQETRDIEQGTMQLGTIQGRIRESTAAIQEDTQTLHVELEELRQQLAAATQKLADWHKERDALHQAALNLDRSNGVLTNQLIALDGKNKQLTQEMHQLMQEIAILRRRIEEHDTEEAAGLQHREQHVSQLNSQLSELVARIEQVTKIREDNETHI